MCPGSILTGVNGQEVRNRGDLDRLLAAWLSGRAGQRLDLTFRPAADDEPVSRTVYPRILACIHMLSR